MRLTVGRKILGSCLVIVILFMLLSGYIFTRSQTVAEDFNDLVGRVGQIKTHGDGIQIQLYKQASFARTYYLTGNQQYAQGYEAAKKDMWQQVNALETMLVTAEGKERLGELKVILLDYNKAVDAAVDIRRQSGQEEVVKFLPKIVMTVDRAEKKTEEFSTYINGYAENQQQAVNEEVLTTNRTMWVINLLAVILAIIISFRLSRKIAVPLAKVAFAARQIAEGNLTAPKSRYKYQGKDEIGDMLDSFATMTKSLRMTVFALSQTAEAVTSAGQQLMAVSEESAGAANQIANTAAKVAGGAEQQTDAVKQALDTVEEISSAITHIANNAVEASERSTETSQTVATGRTAMQEATAQMLEIRRTVSDAAAVVKKLGDSSQQIGNIVSVISGIAGQTNLLALNAAIESARAGEHGRGFAVVAEEVRKLAEQSQAAAKQIAEIIGIVQNDTEITVRSMQRGLTEVEKGTQLVAVTDERLNQINSMITNLNTKVQEITAASEQLANASSAVGISMQNVRAVAAETVTNTQLITSATEDQSAAIEEVAASSQSLCRMAEDMRSQVAKFRC